MAEITKSPGTMADDSTVGTVAWSNPDNAKVSDNTYSIATGINFGYGLASYSVKIVKADGSLGSEKARSEYYYWPDTDTYKEYGSSSDLWGESWTSEDINNPNFGIVVSAGSAKYDDYGEKQSHYLKATNLGFSIPSGATINGIKADIELKNTGHGANGNVDHIRITVYYTEPSNPILSNLSSISNISSIHI